MLHGFKNYLLDLGKSENTAAAYLRDAKLFLAWCKTALGIVDVAAYGRGLCHKDGEIGAGE